MMCNGNTRRVASSTAQSRAMSLVGEPSTPTTMVPRGTGLVLMAVSLGICSRTQPTFGCYKLWSLRGRAHRALGPAEDANGAGPLALLLTSDGSDDRCH